MAVTSGPRILLAALTVTLYLTLHAPSSAQPFDMATRTFTVPVRAATEYCRLAKALNTTSNGLSGHKNEISKRYAILAGAPPNVVLLGWGYLNYGGSAFFQLVNVTRLSHGILVNGPSPIIHYPGSAYTALTRSLAFMALPQRMLPPPYSNIQPSTRFQSFTCPQ